MGPWGARGTERLVSLPGLGQPLPLPAFLWTQLVALLQGWGDAHYSVA